MTDKTTNYAVFDKETTETFALIDLTKKKKRSSTRLFTMMFTDEEGEVEALNKYGVYENWWTSKELTDFECRLFVFLSTSMNKENTVRLMHDEIAEKMHVRRERVTLALGKLTKLGMISTPRMSIVIIDPHLAWKDKLKLNSDVLDSAHKPRVDA